jgi:hypothetical protein
VVVRPRVTVRPYVIRRYEPVRHRYLPYPVWCAPPAPVCYFDEEPFFFNAALGVFFSGAQIWIQVGSTPPPGYGFYDPYCHEMFFSVFEYTTHCDHHHQPLLQVMPADGRMWCGSGVGPYRYGGGGRYDD